MELMQQVQLSTTGSSTEEDASSFFGGKSTGGSDEGTPESATADASKTTEGTTGTSPLEGNRLDTEGKLKQGPPNRR